MKRTIRKVLCLLLLLLLFPMQTRGAVESETTAQSEKLRLNKSSCLKKPVFMRVSAISISLLITN